jgi:hypothetical protein
MKLRAVWMLLALPVLAGCVDDRASFQIDGRNSAVIVIRQQRWLWDKTVEMAVVAARLPDCQRRHKLGDIPVDDSEVELYQPGSATYVLQVNKKMFLIETTTCEGFQKLSEAPPMGLGPKLGTFEVKDGKYRFVGNPEAAKTPVPAEAAPAAAAPMSAAPAAQAPAAATPAPAPVDSGGTFGAIVETPPTKGR